MGSSSGLGEFWNVELAKASADAAERGREPMDCSSELDSSEKLSLGERWWLRRLMARGRVAGTLNGKPDIEPTSGAVFGPSSKRLRVGVVGNVVRSSAESSQIGKLKMLCFAGGGTERDIWGGDGWTRSGIAIGLVGVWWG